jgi:hypothetical protein
MIRLRVKKKNYFFKNHTYLTPEFDHGFKSIAAQFKTREDAVFVLKAWAEQYYSNDLDWIMDIYEPEEVI